MQQLKDFSAIASQSPDSALNEFLAIVESTEQSEATTRIIQILQNEIAYRKTKKNNK